VAPAWTLDDLLTQPAGHSFATVYIRERPFSPAGFPDHELGTGVLIYSGPNGRGAAGSYISHGPSPRRADSRVYHHFHLEQVVPAASEVPLDDLRRAAREFLATSGDRPECVQWRSYADGHGGSGEPPTV
jgi:Immunity protein Imm1